MSISPDLTNEALAVDIDSASRMLKVSNKTIRRLIYSGELRALRIGRCYRIRIAEIHAFLRRQEERQANG